MHSMCMKRRATEDGRQQQGPGGGRDSTHMRQCVCVCLVGNQGCSRDTMRHLHQKGSKRGCTNGTQANKQGTMEIKRQKPRQRRQSERAQH